MISPTHQNAHSPVPPAPRQPKASLTTAPADVRASSADWADQLSAPRSEVCGSTVVTLFTKRDLETLQSLFSRLRLPWRYFLADSGFLQISIPEIASIVATSRKYASDPRERFEATRHFLKTIIHYGPDSPQGTEIITRVNDVHREMGVDPRSPAFDFVLYTLSRGFVESLRRYSRHRPTKDEELALYRLMKRVGEKMGAQSLSDSYEDFIEASERFKKAAWSDSDTLCREVARSLLDNALKRVPRPLRPLVRSALLSLVSPETLKQLKLEQPSQLTRAAVRLLFSSIA